MCVWFELRISLSFETAWEYLDSFLEYKNYRGKR